MKEAIIHANSLAETTDPETLANYLKWQVVHGQATTLHKAIVDQNFRFNGTVIPRNKEL